MTDPQTGGNSHLATTQPFTPNPIPPPPNSASRRSSSSSFPRPTPDRVLADVSLGSDTSYASLHQASLLDSPGAASNFSTETTTTIDIPDELDAPDSHGIVTESVQTTNGSNPPTYSNLESTGPMQPPPPIYYPGELPPAYQVAAALPTYEEAELTKGSLLSLLITKKLVYT